MREIRWWFSCE